MEERIPAADPATAPVVVVTGAAGAIGSATARQFLQAGFSVVGLDRSASADLDARVAQAADVPHERGVTHARDARYAEYLVDLRDDARVAEAMAEARATMPGARLAHVLGIAGGALADDVRTRDDPMLLEPAAFRESVEANLVTQFTILRAVLPWLRDGAPDDRSVTLVSSFNALGGWGMPAYSAAKAAIIGMMHALAVPLGTEGIRLNVVAPGTIRTPRTERLWAGEPGHFEALERTTALGRLGTPDDVARVFLACATLLTHVTGHVLVVDGGQSVKRG